MRGSVTPFQCGGWKERGPCLPHTSQHQGKANTTAKGTVQCLRLKWNWDVSNFVASETLTTSSKLVQKTPLDLPSSELLQST
ncbi:hypothetical protein Y1Q_0008699 [Alligator mississippiensis]|uniref:Uncharacterized protein n=1 Tax=Alligator mississippiensis TaxID=8496 RepID=A0A151N9K8_ALLMI|nr:hypothetical protein Y1Q_0008699 [Alligator mississippiensis]